MKKKLCSALRNRRGITIAETIIALVIILVVSAATISLVLAASTQENQQAFSAEVKQHGENAVACFRWAEDPVEFEEAMKKLGFTRVLGSTVFTLEKPAYRIEVEVDYGEKPNQFEISAVNIDGEEIYGFTYEK